MTDLESDLRARAEAGEAATIAMMRATGATEFEIRHFMRRYRDDAARWRQDTLDAIRAGRTTEKAVLDAVNLTGGRDRAAYTGSH